MIQRLAHTPGRSVFVIWFSVSEGRRTYPAALAASPTAVFCIFCIMQKTCDGGPSINNKIVSSA